MKTLPVVLLSIAFLPCAGTLRAQAPKPKPQPAPIVPTGAPEVGPPAEAAGSGKEEKPKTEEKEGKPSESQAPERYVMRSGDNPWKIAQAHGITLPQLLAVNEIEDDRNLKVGDILVLPEGVESKNPPKPGPPPVAKPVEDPKPGAPKDSDDSKKSEETGWEYYTIESGDNPWKIAKEKKLDYQAILELNEGTDFRKLAVGQKIKIPKAE